jgi:peptidoglycan/xylan/chitin deacetylase (PgdA/CDA1 family)
MSAPSFTWPAGRRGAVSVSFDDARPSQLENGMPILDRFGARGTFYVSFRAFDQRTADWRAAAERGHEIGNHTVSHPCSGNFPWCKDKALEDFTLDRMEGELVDANSHIEAAVGAAPRSFAYPCGQTFVGRGEQRQSYVPLVARHFTVGRGFLDEYLNDPAFCDLAHVGGTDFDRMLPDALEQLMESTLEAGAWLVLAGHDVCAGDRRQGVREDTLTALCELAATRDDIWLDTVATIGSYVEEQRR